MNAFTIVDYAAFGLWILISIGLSYLVVRKFGFFGGNIENQKTLAIGLIAGHLLYLVWKTLWLFILN
tara:strand:- start:1131 stop:1331 length:201 start_codon:yes stop_codon:yes gene_type:complete